MTTALALACGVLFGAGLAISGMTDPAKVQAFLDVAGDWDPSLAFVMGAALLVSSAGYAVVRRREAPWVADRFHVPEPGRIDLPLVAGAATFGIGWGLAGFCPGPALAALVTGAKPVLVFAAAMLAGTALARSLRTLAARGPAAHETRETGEKSSA